jgi:hypothetical protein
VSTGTHCLPTRESARFELVQFFRGFSIGSSRPPVLLASRTRPIWQYWAVPSLSGLLSTLTRVPGIRLPSASTPDYDQGQAMSFHHGTVERYFVAHTRPPDMAPELLCRQGRVLTW